MRLSGQYASPEDIAKLAAELQIEGLIVRQGQIDETIIAASPRLKVIAKHGTGVNYIDLDAAARLGIPVLQALGANARSVAEHAIALSIALLKDVVPLDRAVKGGEWPKASYIGRDLAGAAIGLVGVGAIGQEVASLARALGMSVTVFDPYTAELPQAIRRETELDALLATSDIVSLHCPLTKETRHLINGERLARMKPSAFPVNTARGNRRRGSPGGGFAQRHHLRSRTRQLRGGTAVVRQPALVAPEHHREHPTRAERQLAACGRWQRWPPATSSAS
jgi:D-3-phosphoglycerate dehydrogenase